MDHEPFIREALSLAERGRGWVSPNPMVGALVVKDEQVVGRGWHQQFGDPHAEVFALREAGERARGATLYCTLEPCNHTGKTPPCVQAILQTGIRTVVLGARDPNPVATGGLEALRAAGVSVVTGILELQCRALNAAFFKHVRTGLPLVSLKWAMSADGKLATASGDSKWITGNEARAFAHGLRIGHDAVLIGIKTLLADGAQLTCRLGDKSCRQPRRVILDSAARTPLDAPLWSAPGGGPVLIFCRASAPAAQRAALQGKGAEVVALEGAGPASGLPLEPVLQALAQRGILSVLVEGGAGVLGSFIDARLADRVYVFVAPKIIGGRESVPAVGGRGAAKVADGLELRAPTVTQLGSDWLLTGQLGPWDWLNS